MADTAEKAFLAFLEGTSDAQQLSAEGTNSAHLPLGAAASEANQPAAAASITALQNPCDSSLDHGPDQQAPSTSSAPPHQPSSTNQHVLPVQPTGLHSADIRSSASSEPARAWAQPPVELTVKHVGFLGSLAHALVHLQKASEGLSLLRAAACIMRTTPPAFHMWFQGSPDPQVLHAHVLMDLVSSARLNFRVTLWLFAWKLQLLSLLACSACYERTAGSCRHVARVVAFESWSPTVVCSVCACCDAVWGGLAYTGRSCL